MKIEAAEMGERVATEELVRELVRNDARRGEFMIMSDDADDSRFVQVACDYDEVGGKSDGLFDLEYRDGKNGYLYHCSRRVSADEVERVFLDELAGRGEWRGDFEWEQLKGFNMTPFDRAVEWILRRLTLTPRGGKRKIRLQMIPAEGLRLRRCLPSGLAFMAFWCIGWDAVSLCGIVPKFIGVIREHPENGFISGIVIGVVFPLIGVAMTVYFFRLLWKHLRPSYEVRLVGGLLKEGERATFEYLFKGDAEEVKSVAFATALYARPGGRRGTVTLGEAPGAVNDLKKFTHSLEIASGSVTLEMPRIAETCHTAFRYYFRATVVFKSGLSVASSYRIPLK